MTPEKARALAQRLAERARETGNVGRAAKVDDRPRFKNGWLKDEREDLLERLDVELANESSARGARYARENREELERLLALEAEHQKKAREAELRASTDQADFERDREALQRGERIERLEVDRNKIDERIAGLRATAPEKSE